MEDEGPWEATLLSRQSSWQPGRRVSISRGLSGEQLQHLQLQPALSAKLPVLEGRASLGGGAGGDAFAAAAAAAVAAGSPHAGMRVSIGSRRSSWDSSSGGVGGKGATGLGLLLPRNSSGGCGWVEGEGAALAISHSVVGDIIAEEPSVHNPEGVEGAVSNGGRGGSWREAAACQGSGRGVPAAGALEVSFSQGVGLGPSGGAVGGGCDISTSWVAEVASKLRTNGGVGGGVGGRCGASRRGSGHDGDGDLFFSPMERTPACSGGGAIPSCVDETLVQA